MVEALFCRSCGAPLVHEKMMSGELFFICHYCGSRQRVSDTASAVKITPENNADASGVTPLTCEELNAPAERPESTGIRLENDPGVRFFVRLKGRPETVTSVFSFLVSLCFIGLPAFIEYRLWSDGSMLAAACLMWGLSFAFLVFMLCNAKRAGLRGWTLRRVVRNLFHLAVPNGTLFFIHLGLFSLLDREDLLVERGRIILRGGSVFRWNISRNVSDVEDVVFRSAGIQPLFCVVFKDAVWHLGLSMSLDERRWVRTELAKYLGK